MKKILLIAIGLICLSGIAAAQPRPVAADPAQAASAPDVYQARYEGGVFGSSSKEKGWLKVDHANLRVVFHRADGTEMFSLPYESLLILFPDSKESVPQSGKVISALPLPGAGLANLMSKSSKYANITFDDPDVDVKGTASFRFDSKEALLAFVHKLGTNAKMTQRGDAYYRPRLRPIF